MSSNLAGHIASTRRKAQLAEIDRQLAARRPRVDSWAQMVAADHDHRETLRVGHRQRLEKAEFTIMRLERRGRHWWTPADEERYVKACRDRNASKEWLGQDELDRAYSSGQMTG